LKTLAALALGPRRFSGHSLAAHGSHPVGGTVVVHAGLFLLLLRHFAAILSEEPLRVLRARSLVVSRPWGPGWLGSLAHALASVFRRAIDRAERFLRRTTDPGA
jgi:hypothetical protein